MKPTRVETTKPGELLELLRPFRPLRVVVEASPFWPWIYELLVAKGIEFVLANAKRLRAIAEAEQKNDAVDAELLARMLQAGLIPVAYAKPREQREQARLLRHRAVLVRERTRLLNRVHARLHPVGLRMARGELGTQRGRAWLLNEAWPRLEAEQRRVIETHLELIDLLDALVKRLDRRIDEVAVEQPAVELLRTIPGIGAYRALMLGVEILPLRRFRRPRHLVSYAGLAPRTRSSGGKIRHGSIPAGANRWLRWVLVQTVVSHKSAAPESRLSVYYEEQKKRVGWQTARVATARKLCRAIYRMLESGESWQN